MQIPRTVTAIWKTIILNCISLIFCRTLKSSGIVPHLLRYHKRSLEGGSQISTVGLSVSQDLPQATKSFIKVLAQTQIH